MSTGLGRKRGIFPPEESGRLMQEFEQDTDEGLRDKQSQINALQEALASLTSRVTALENP